LSGEALEALDKFTRSLTRQNSSSCRVRSWKSNVLFNLAQTLRSLTTSPISTAVDQAHLMAQRRLEAGGPALSVPGSVDDGAGRQPARVPITATPRGSRRVTLNLSDAFVDRLIDLGHLMKAGRHDRNRVLLALYRFLDFSALGDARR
jgi:hypothetical protein